MGEEVIRKKKKKKEGKNLNFAVHKIGTSQTKEFPMWLFVISEYGFEISAIQPGVGVGADGG
jgi:hypothetical protein